VLYSSIVDVNLCVAASLGGFSALPKGITLLELGCIIFFFGEYDLVFFLWTHSLNQAKTGLLELCPCETDVHLHHLIEDWDKRTILAKPECLINEI
jgi:hypothetical protein